MTTPVVTTFTAEATAGVQWNVEGATIVSKLNEPFMVRLEVQAEAADADPLEMLGSAAELTMQHGENTNGYGGIVSTVRALHHHGTEIRASVTLEPALSALRHTRDTRIFQGKTVPEILEIVLGETLGPYGRSATQSLQRSYPAREYTVQYQESHFDFVHRLMEEEGIVYYFEQDGPLEVMTLTDMAASHPPIPGGLLNYSAATGDAGLQDTEYVRSLEALSTVVGSDIATRHFNWTHPSQMITGTATGGAGPGDGPDGSSVGPKRESYQHDEPLTLHAYGGTYAANDAEGQVLTMRETQLRDSRRFQGHGTVVAMRAGLRFDLQGHPSVGLNTAYTTIAVQHFVGNHARSSGVASDAQMHYLNRFTTVPTEVCYRPRRTRARPRVHGIQTAIVTGPAGEEIHCDEHGRVKVQFPWDRVGQMDDRTTVWIRCMQTSAGAGFGAFVLPRVGMEVVVSFIDGDPDRPIVTGTVFNGDNPNPYPMPEKKMCSVFKTNTYPGGGGFNELRLDDSKDAEEIWLHGQKDWNTLILNDLTRDVLHDEVQNVGNNRTRTVGVDETLTVGNDRVRQVGSNETVTVGQNRTKTVGMNETLTVALNRTRMVGVAETVTVGAMQTLTVGASRNVTVGDNQTTGIGANRTTQIGADDVLEIVGSRTLKVGGASSTSVGDDVSANLGSNFSESVGSNRTRTVGGLENIMVAVNQSINVGVARQVTVGAIHKMTAGQSFEIVCGESSFKMESGGKVTITGTEFEFVASGEVKVGGSMIHLN
ncbi:MAG: type VI secretion system Vgr family protein [Sandaracinaceae bacterium]